MRTWPVAAALLLSCGPKSGGPSLPACPATDEFLAVSPLAAADIVRMAPLGNLNPPGHVFPTEHQYLYLPLEPGGLPRSVPLVSPGELWLVGVASSEHLSASPVYIDYDLTLAPCAEVSFRLGHVATLDPALASSIGGATGGDCQTYTTGGQDYRRCQRSVKVQLHAGDPIGTVGGNPGQYALDLGAQDARKPAAAFANPAGYGESLHSRCPLDSFGAAIRTALLAKVTRTAEPRCGTHMQDLAGTAQGNWRKVGAGTYPEDPHLALVHDLNDPAKVALSLGTSFAGASPGVWSPSTAASGRADRDPSSVIPDGQTWCWSSGSVRLVVTMPSASTLRADAQPGTCGAGPWTLSAGAVDFAR